MSFNAHSAEVAEDYRHALEDLTMNSRYEITNLTVVARENTEHALAISEAVQDHIKKVAPQRKLPALYVLDSIVKNVGTPYTLFFGRKLYQTFMDAYASVDNMTRRKMDEMLKTWKEAVPGSIDTRPVFPPDVTRPIENALIRARTTALQAQQESMRGQQQLLNKGRMPVPFRNTPTPPGVRPGSQPPAPFNQLPVPGVNGNLALSQQSYPIHPSNTPQPILPPQPTPQPAQPQQIPLTYQRPLGQDVYGAPQPGLSIDRLSGDIQQLIAATKAQFAQTPNDPSVQTRLKALLDLQSLLQHGNLHQDQLVLVKNQVAELAVNIRVPNTQTRPFTSTPPIISQHSTPIPPVAVAQTPPVSAPPAPVSLDSLFGHGALAALLSGTANTTKSPVSVSQALPPNLAAALKSPPPRPAEPVRPSSAAPSDPLALIAALKKSGLIGSVPGSAPPLGAAASPFPLPHGLPGMPPLPTAAIRSTGMLAAGPIELTAASLKQFRPHLIPLLYEGLGQPCTQCGRRFPSDEEGRKKKTAHMDWHFRVHQRIAEAEKRGLHRSWYVDQADWVKSREAIDTDYVPPQSGGDATAAGGSSSAKTSGPKKQYILVPEDSRTNTVCPICQEKFETTWLDEAQDWVWMDAMWVGDRVFHPSCHAEVTRDGRGNTPSYSKGTPEPVLGKRKAEYDDHSSMRGKLKVEGY